MKGLDLFSGCGVFSKGFEDAGLKIKYAIDSWEGCKEKFDKIKKDTWFSCTIDDVHTSEYYCLAVGIVTDEKAEELGLKELKLYK